MAVEGNNGSITSLESLENQRILWKSKAQSIPSLRGGKKTSFPLTVELVTLVGANRALNLECAPEVHTIADSGSWGSYARFLCVSGLAYNKSGELHLTEQGRTFLKNPSKSNLASLFQDRYRIFGEIVLILEHEKMTVDEVNQIVNELYNMDWGTTNSIRSRFDWLDVLGLIQPYGSFKWGATEEGLALAKTWAIITPEAVNGKSKDNSVGELDEPPVIISELLEDIGRNPSNHIKRNTYNMWLPSPNMINNLREIIQAAYEPINREDYFHFIEERFNLKTSSVESMMPFLKASNYIEEVKRNVYQASSISKAWLETGSDLDLIRILHAKARFVGEILELAQDGVSRRSLYEAGELYGQNSTRVSWIVKFLLETGLLEEPRYLYVRTTPLGVEFYKTLPLADSSLFAMEKPQEELELIEDIPEKSETERLENRLELTSQNPMAEEKQSGVAFEEVIAEVFAVLGFDAKHIGGPGDTDVIVQWKDIDGTVTKAIVDGKSKSAGGVTHNDINIVALESHKAKNNASFIAIVAHAFSGKTINAYAKDHSIALITTDELARCLKASLEVGLSPDELSLIFKVPDGLSGLEDIIEDRRRELQVIATVVGEFEREQEQIGDLSPRDLFLLLRNSKNSASIEELDKAFHTLSDPAIGVLQHASISRKGEQKGFVLKNAKSVARHLHAIASAIEGKSPDTYAFIE